MEIRKDSRFARAYKSIYALSDSSLPRNFCAFFWSTLFAPIYFIGTIPSYVVNYFMDKYLGEDLNRSGGIKSTFFALFTVNMILGFFTDPTEENSRLEHILTIFLVIFSTIFIIGLFSIIAIYIVNNSEKFKIKKFDSKAVEFIKTGYSDFKNKTCTIINWK